MRSSLIFWFSSMCAAIKGENDCTSGLFNTIALAYGEAVAFEHYLEHCRHIENMEADPLIAQFEEELSTSSVHDRSFAVTQKPDAQANVDSVDIFSSDSNSSTEQHVSEDTIMIFSAGDQTSDNGFVRVGLSYDGRTKLIVASPQTLGNIFANRAFASNLRLKSDDPLYEFFTDSTEREIRPTVTTSSTPKTHDTLLPHLRTGGYLRLSRSPSAGVAKTSPMPKVSDQTTALPFIAVEEVPASGLAKGLEHRDDAPGDAVRINESGRSTTEIQLNDEVLKTLRSAVNSALIQSLAELTATTTAGPTIEADALKGMDFYGSKIAGFLQRYLPWNVYSLLESIAVTN